MVQKMTPTDSVPIWWYNALAIFVLWSPHLTHRGNTAAKGIHQPTHRTTRTLQYDRHIFVCCAASCHLIQSSIYFSFQLLSRKDCKFWIPWYRAHGDLHVSVSIKKASVSTLLIAADFFVSCHVLMHPNHNTSICSMRTSRVKRRRQEWAFSH